MNTPKRGRPASDNPLTPAERQRARRAKIKAQTFKTVPGQQLNVLLSPEASMALQMLCFNGDLSRKRFQKAVIEELLIEGYAKYQSELVVDDD
jgi:hypothetical protein